MELKEGMYIRFFDGTIGKVADYFYDENCVNGHTILLEGRDYWSCCEKGQFEASYNLIDLIKPGDYVNGSRVMYKISNGEDISFPYEHVEVEEDEDIGYERNVICYKNEDIKDVVTKEQFNSIKYEVGE